MLQQRAFHFKRTDPIAGTLDHIVLAADEPKIALLVARGTIAGQYQSPRNWRACSAGLSQYS